VPNLIGKGERWLVLGIPGSGKSVLARQIALGVAAGRHPLFPSEAIEPHRTLFIDLEMPEDILRNEYRRQMGPLAWSDDGMAWLWYKPGGIDLGKMDDYREFRAVIDRVQPALVCLSPIYKAHGANGEWDVLASDVTSAIESVRAVAPVTFWMEHHASKSGTQPDHLDPYGSGRWTRWPDFVIGLTSDEKEPPFERLRFGVQKARDWGRDFPATIERGSTWSWEGRYPRGFQFFNRPEPDLRYGR
jgi:RecA-family ATPase